ncbi:MAG TPA: TolC family protein [Algoriphagus sp.]|nr:TolC family protein [Algoriphagus sp.]
MENKTLNDFGMRISGLRFQKDGRKQKTSDFSFLTFFLLLTLYVSPFTRELKAQSLDDYLIQAAENNPGLQAAYARYEASLERVKQPGLPDPELQAGFFFKPMERFMGNQQADLQLMQMFPWFGMIGSQKEEANQMALAQYQLFLEEKNQLLFQVKSTWYELFRLNEEIRISKENLEFLKKYERLALIKLQAAAPGSSGATPATASPASPTPTSSAAGSSAMSSMSSNPTQMAPSSSSMSSGMGASSGSGMGDVLQIRIEMKELENNIALLEANVEPLQIKFNQLLNREIKEAIAIAESLQPVALEVEKLAILDSIKSNNPMLAMYDFEMAALDQQARMAKLDGRPMLGAGVNYMPFTARMEDGMSMGGEDMIMPMVTMTLPIYRKKTQSRIKEAEYLKEAAFLNRQKTENLLAMEWANAFRDWEDAERKISLYSEQTDLVNQNLQLQLTAYSNSGQDFEEVLRTQQRLLDYQLRRINAINQQYQSLAMLEMLASTDFNHQ